MQIITAAQCRAARALLNWSQPELAERCDIHVQTISNFEKESSTPSKTTLDKIMRCFDFAGIDLLKDDGVKKSQHIITVYEGPDVHYRYLDTLYHDLKDSPGSDIYITGLTTQGAYTEEEKIFVQSHIERLKKAGLKERILCAEGDRQPWVPESWYRGIARKYFSTGTFQLYNNKLALREWGENARIIVIENKIFADAFRKLFNFAWDHSKSIK